MSTIFKTAPITELRANLPEYIDNLDEDGPLQIIRRSKPVAYILSPSVFEKLLNDLEDIEDIRDSLAVIEDYKNGVNMVDADKFFEDLGL